MVGHYARVAATLGARLLWCRPGAWLGERPTAFVAGWQCARPCWSLLCVCSLLGPAGAELVGPITCDPGRAAGPTLNAPPGEPQGWCRLERMARVLSPRSTTMVLVKHKDTIFEVGPHEYLFDPVARGSFGYEEDRCRLFRWGR